MPLNARTKGQEGEREIARDLNAIVDGVRAELGLPTVPTDKPIVQRNQNQSAVGGCDLVGTFGLAIEIKRQEQLSINTWWTQCVKSAEERDELPVLLFRQNTAGGGRKAWRCLLPVRTLLNLTDPIRGEISYEDFKVWFRELVRREYKVGLPESEGKPVGPVVTVQADEGLVHHDYRNLERSVFDGS